MTFAAPIKVTIQLDRLRHATRRRRAQSIRDIKEQEVYFGEIPLMTENGTFIINGTERVVVASCTAARASSSTTTRARRTRRGKLLYTARIIPYRGSWLDFEFDHKDIIYVRIDRRRKMHATVLLRALGYTTRGAAQLLLLRPRPIYPREGRASTRSRSSYDLLAGQRATRDIKIRSRAKSSSRRTASSRARRSRSSRRRSSTRCRSTPRSSSARSPRDDVVDEETGEVLLECNEEVTEDKLERAARSAASSEFKVLFIDGLNVGRYLRDTLLADKVKTPEDAIMEIYRRLRPGDPPTLETAKNLFHNLFFNPERYDLSKVGRLKLNYKFYGLETSRSTTRSSRKRDILETVRYLIELKNGRGSVDDIDHLGNRRVRAVGELMENQYRIGLVRMERAIKERMSMSQEIETLMPHDLINAKPVSRGGEGVLRHARSSRSSWTRRTRSREVTHKRRLSALGPGGLTRERAGFEVRDVHPTHYGRICPIETPEGPNIGLIASLSTFARVNEYGFVETPYRKVEDGTRHRRGRVLLGARGREQVHRAGERADSTRRASSPTTSSRRAATASS